VFFRITNSGGADDRLLKVTSSAAGGEATLSRHRMTGAGSAYTQTVDSIAVPAGDSRHVPARCWCDGAGEGGVARG
jgi:copper(I)-binding protein